MASSIKGPLGWLWDQGKRLYRRMRGETVDKLAEPTPNLRDRFVYMHEQSGWLSGTGKRLVEGELRLNSWVLDFRPRSRGSGRSTTASRLPRPGRGPPSPAARTKR